MDVYSLMGCPGEKRDNIIEVVQMTTNEQLLPIGTVALVEESQLTAARSHGMNSGQLMSPITVFVPCVLPIDDEIIPRISFVCLTDAFSLAQNESSCLLRDSPIYDADLHRDLLNPDFILEELRKKRMCSFVCTPDQATCESIVLLLQQFALSYKDVFSYKKPEPAAAWFTSDDTITFLYFFRAFDMHKVYNDSLVKPDVVAVVGRMSTKTSARSVVPMLFSDSMIWGSRAKTMRLAQPKLFMQNLRTVILTTKSRTNVAAKTDDGRQHDGRQASKNRMPPIGVLSARTNTYVVSTTSGSTSTYGHGLGTYRSNTGDE